VLQAPTPCAGRLGSRSHRGSEVRTRRLRPSTVAWHARRHKGSAVGRGGQWRRGGARPQGQVLEHNLLHQDGVLGRADGCGHSGG
jgi:hypothetical protein